jgi:hypothetical protein
MPAALMWDGGSVYLKLSRNCLGDKVQPFNHKRHSLKTKNISSNNLKLCSDSTL